MKRMCLLLMTVIMSCSASIVTGQTEQRTASVDALFRDYAQPGAPGASVMIIKDGKVLLAKSYGLANREDKVPSAPDTNYRLASVTKQFTAMAVMMLADRKQLSLEAPITDYFPEFPAYGKQITIRHLLNHTSGLLDYEDLIPQGTVLPVVDINVLRLLQQEQKTYFAPGTEFRYSNTGYAFLALIVEKVSRQTFASFLKENIFQPLHMDHTVAYEPGISSVHNRAYGYTQSHGDFAKTDQSLTSSVLGDGGIYSSVKDLYQWDQSLYTTKLVSRKMLAEAFTPGKSTLHDKTIEYGFGWFVCDYRGLRNIWHSGNTIGFSTRIERFPDKKFTVIILTNRNDAHLSEIPHQIADLYLFN
jgi:CubicO group peptidase (beta-lactamase class C family)